MKPQIRVASPPAKPRMVFDGDCGFCRFWIKRWQGITRDKVEYVPFQDAASVAQFSEIPRENFEKAVYLIETDGSVFSGAEAAFRALGYNPRERWFLYWYEHSPAFTHATEWAYRFVANHRTFFSTLTRLGWGQHVEPSSHLLIRWAFLRSMGLIYLAAFLSLWGQIDGLIGRNGILPAKATMESMREGARARGVGLDRYRTVPTLCWISSSDGFLHAQCAAGTVLAISVIVGLAPAPCLFLLWLIYLSLVTVCQVFLSYQWDILLLETGFLAIFFAPLQILPGLKREAPPSRVVLWLLRWLLFRLMFKSGCVKLLSHDRSWHDLTALNFHYETQPLPTWVAWYVHQLPGWIQTASTLIMFFIELVVPFLIFAPRRFRHFACGAFIFFQVLIFLTGNYCFFNLLTIALCLLLLDDEAVKGMWRVKVGSQKSEVGSQMSESGSDIPPHPGHLPKEREGPGPAPSPFRAAGRSSPHWPVLVTVPLACVLVLISLAQFSAMFGMRQWTRPRMVVSLYEWVAPLGIINTYGLFAVMTTTRTEIIIEGSNDGKTWLPYEFKYKPGDVKRRPVFVAPHQPRLDWQMWFAALGSYQHNPWLLNFCYRLLQGSPPVLGLLERNPFPQKPPRYIRAVAYEYRFTNFATRRRTGAWWKRDPKGLYLPAFSLQPG